MEREHLGSRLGFILLSAGCAIGIGNVWKFPYMAGANGGGIFVLLYFVFLIVLGLPVMTMEFAMGRASQKSPVKMYQALEPKGSKWHLHRFPALAGNYLLLMFYTTVAGWMLQYFVFAAQGKFENATTESISALFSGMLANPVMMTAFMVIITLFGVGACLLGVQKGIERITKWMMLALLAIILVLVVNSLRLEGAADGLWFYLVPNTATLKDVEGGFFSAVVGAMNQAFFTLSIGMGSMAIFGSYLKKDRSLMGEALNIAVLDTFVAIASGLIIFPAIFTYGLDSQAGPPLIFETLPNIFAHMEFGSVWGSL
ncbi:MAG: sodium-dependent transporter, partial [Clostridia bacterium]|nr:sodium-dependent transporter [Clostridia bacterium]